MTFKTKTPLVDFKGNQIENLFMGDILSNILATSKSTNPALSYQLGKKLATEDEVELKSEDIVFIKGILKESTYTPIVVGQIEEALEGK